MKLTGKVALFIGGTLFGSAGLKLLGSRDARKVYSHVTVLPQPRCAAKIRSCAMLSPSRKAALTFWLTRKRLTRIKPRKRKPLLLKTA